MKKEDLFLLFEFIAFIYEKQHINITIILCIIISMVSYFNDAMRLFQQDNFKLKMKKIDSQKLQECNSKKELIMNNRLANSLDCEMLNNSNVKMSYSSKTESTSQFNSKQTYQCTQCHHFFACYEDDDIEISNNQFKTLIKVSEIQLLCCNCLEKQILIETQQQKLLQENYIFHKEFQSSFFRKQLKRRLTQQSIERSPKQQEIDIQNLRHEEAEIDREISQFKCKAKQLKERVYQNQTESKKYWIGFNKLQRRILKVQQKSNTIKMEETVQRCIIDILGSNNLIHLFTGICVDDEMGYILNIPMGKYSNEINWQEIAVGLGHIFIFFNYMTIKYAYTFKRIKDILFKGYRTKIQLKGKKYFHYLVYEKDCQKQFGQLMQTILLQTHFMAQHIAQLSSAIEQPQYQNPFQIDLKDLKIADIHIDPFKINEKIRWNAWTKAMRYFLINLKHIITMTSHFDQHL